MKNRSLQRRHFLALNRQILAIFVALCTLCSVSSAQSNYSDRCRDQNKAITVGGSRDEIAHCLVYDPSTQLIITGGTTRSSDFGPANTDYGFLYAVNLDGDWVWGNYFLNQSDSFQQITGCKLSSNGKSVVVLGKTRSQVGLAIVNATTGKITNLYSLEYKDTARDELKPTYETYGAIMLDNDDSTDGKAYLYASFMMDSQQQLIRVSQAVPDRSNEFPEIKYHYTLVKEASPEEQKQLQVPQNMFSMATDKELDSFYLTGTYRGVGSVMKFYKRNALLRWHAKLNFFTSVDAIAVRDTSNFSRAHFFGCGSDSLAARGIQKADRSYQSQAWFFSMDEDGEANWMIRLSGRSLSDPQSLSDSCQGLVFNTQSDTVVAAVETNSPQLRVDLRDSQKDTLLLEIDVNGRLRRAISFSLGDNKFDMLNFPQNLVLATDHFYMSGGLYGFQTQRQSQNYQSLRTRDLDNFLLPLNFGDSPISQCLDAREIKGSDLSPFADFSNNLKSRDYYELFKSSNRDVPKQTRGDQVYRVNYSKFVTSRPLKSFINTPRPCAYQSLMLTEEPQEYFRASEALIFNIAQQTPYASIITQMNVQSGGQTQLIDSKGQIAQGAAFTPGDGGKIGFYAQAVSSLGLNELTLRYCDRLQRLFDLRLQVDVKRNQQPIFAETPQTTFSLRFGESLLYRLPETVDPEGNADAQILVQPFTGYVDFFPPFVKIFNGNRTFEFVVDKEEYAGKEFFFKIVLKEKGGRALGLSYYFQIFVAELPSGGGQSATPVNPQDGGSNQGQSSDGQTSGGQQDGSSGEQTGDGSSGGQTEQTGGGSETQTGDQESTAGGGENIQPPFDDMQTGSRVKHSGKVITSDSFEEEQVTELIFVEMYTTDLVGRTQIKFTQPTDMARVEEENLDQLFEFKVLSFKRINETNKEVEVIDVSYSNFNSSNQTVDVHFRFDEPFRLGLNTEKSDYIIMNLNESYPWQEVITPLSGAIIGKTGLQKQARARIELTFDYQNEQMRRIVVFSKVFFWIFVGFVAIQIALLLYKNVSLITFWILVDYAQLIAYLPLTSSRCVPLVYEFFRPFLVFHAIYQYPGDPGMDTLVHEDYFNLSFRSYSIRQEDLLYMSAMTWIGIFVLIVATDILVCLAVKSTKCCQEGCLHKLLLRLKSQYRFNIYIRYLMTVYLDLVFITGILIADDDGSTALHWTSLLAYLILSVSVFIPFMVMIYLCARFDSLKDKAGKEQFNTLLLKLDKEDRWRIFLPSFFFFRRFATGCVLVLGAREEAPAYLQFVIIISMSALKVFYLAKTEPYVQRLYTSFVTMMELCYFCLAMAIFTFTDSTDDVQLKELMTTVCLTLLCIFFLANIVMAVFFMCTGKETLRVRDQEARQKRRNGLEKRKNEKVKHKAKRKRKKQQELTKIEEKRKEQLEAKRQNMRELGYTEDEIDSKLPLEPVQESGFKFGAVMGKRMVDYGIMSSSTDSEQEAQATAGAKTSKVETQMTEIDRQRRESNPVPMMDFDDKGNDSIGEGERLTSQFGVPTDPNEPLETERLETEAPLTPYRHLFANNQGTPGGGELTGRTADPTNELWMERILVGSKEDQNDQSFNRQPSSSRMAFEDEFEMDGLATDRRLITDENEQEDDFFTTGQRMREREKYRVQDDYSPERDGHPRFQTQLNNTADMMSSRHNILDTSNLQDERIRRMADDC